MSPSLLFSQPITNLVWNRCIDFLFDAAIFRGTSTEMELQHCQFYCKKQIDNNFVLKEMKMRNCSIRYEALYKVSNTVIDHRNEN